MSNLKRYCDDFENIENYEKAKTDNFKGWVIHHRLETHNSDGERRLVDLLTKELKVLDMYWHRPANELIFMTVSEHVSLHFKGKSGYLKGKPAWNKGISSSEETRRKQSEAHKNITEETRKKMSKAHKGHTTWNKGKKGAQKAWNKGKPMSEEQKQKLYEANKGSHWFNNGKINIRSKECPEGFIPGMLK